MKNVRVRIIWFVVLNHNFHGFFGEKFAVFILPIVSICFVLEEKSVKVETNRDIDLLIEKQWSEGLSPEAEDVLREWVSANEEHRKYYERRILLYRWMGIQQRIPIFEKERKKAYGRFLRSMKGENMPFTRFSVGN